MRPGYIQNVFYQLLKPKVQKHFDENQRLQQKSREEILNIQHQKIKDLVKFAYTTSPYYRNKFNQLRLGSKIKLGQFEIKDIPILTKQDLRSHESEFLSESKDVNKLVKGHTGGSTGLPVTVFYEPDSFQQFVAARRTFLTWSGWKPGERILSFWGARQDVTVRRTVKKSLGEWISGEKILPAYEFDENIMAAWLLVLKKYNPVLLYGYTSIIAAFARYINEIGAVIRPLKGVYTTAEMLYPAQRQLIEKVFGCKVYNQYGCREVPGIASECQMGNMHMLTSMAYVETRKSGSVNQKSELIVTSLANWVMPFIRYEVGDLGELKEGSCPCGLSLPIMEIGFGRTNDILVTSGGKHIYPSYFIHLLDGFSELQEYQFRQITPSQFVLYIREKQANELLVKKLQTLEIKMRKDFGHDINLYVNVVKRIKKTAAGKHQFVISDLN